LMGAGIYFAAQAAMHAPQMQWLTGALTGRWRQLAVHVPASWVPGAGLRRRQLDAALLLAPLAVGALAGIKIKYAVLAVVAIGLIAWVIARPVMAAYLLIFLTPLLVGIGAGAVVPVLRPNEALMLLLGLAIGLRWLARLRSGEIRWPRLDAVDVSLIALGITSSVLPLAMMVVRQRQITMDDLLYCVVIWKLLAEYVIVRTVITTREQANRCLVLLMVAAAIVCFVGIAQAAGAPHVSALLTKFYSPSGATAGPTATDGRGGSLLGLPAASADLAILGLSIAVAMLVRGYPRRLWLGGLAVLFALGVVAAAEFSTMIGLIVALVVLVMLTKSGRIVAYAVPVALLGGVLLWPVIQLRLEGFHSPTGLPVSWINRLYNLKTYFWPVLFSDHNWILGVRPSARIATSVRRYGYVWIESGYTWLLWGGGIPLLASYFAFAGSVIRKGWVYARRPDAAGVAATAVTAAVCSQVFLMILDPHLT
jgi:hypothetical protein